MALVVLEEHVARGLLAELHRSGPHAQQRVAEELGLMEILLLVAQRAQARVVTVATGREQYQAAAVAAPLVVIQAMVVRVVRLALQVLQGLAAVEAVVTVGREACLHKVPVAAAVSVSW